MNNLVDLDYFIADLKKRREDLFGDLDDINFDLEDIETQITMAEVVRVNYRKHFGLPVDHDNAADIALLQQKFAGLSIREMLIRIAADFKGILDLAEARTILVKAGVFKDNRNATTSIVPILSRNNQTFMRVGRGMYVVIGSPDVLRSDEPTTVWTPRGYEKDSSSNWMFTNVTPIAGALKRDRNDYLNLSEFSLRGTKK